MDQYLEKFISALATESGYSENTLAAYRNDLTQFVKFVHERRGSAAELSDLTPELVTAYVDELQQPPSQYAPSTVARKIAAVKSFFHYLINRNIILSDPTAKLSSPKVKKHAPQTLSRAEIDKLLNAPGRQDNPKDLRDHALLSMLCTTGMRVTEIVSLQVEDIDWEHGVVICRGKGGRQRKIPMGTAAEALSNYWHRARSHMAKPASPSVFFLNQRGQKLTRQGVWLILKETAQAAGVAGEVTPHILRHSFARQLVGAGENLRRVQELLGHANLSTTQVYRQTDREPVDDTAPAVISQ